MCLSPIFRSLAAAGAVALLTATPSAALADQTVYSDSLAAGWQDWSWSSTRNFASATQVYSGTAALSTQITAGWGGLYLNAVTPPAGSSFEKVRFRLYSSEPGGHPLSFSVYDAPGNPAGSVAITATGTWTLHEVSLSTLGYPAQISGLVWQDQSGSAQDPFYLDEIVLVSSSTPPPPASGPALAVDAALDRHAISTDIYGMSYCSEALAGELRLPVNRWGGNATTRYNWQLDVSNRAGDWYFQNIAEPHTSPNPLPDDSSADQFVEANRRTGTKSVITIPMIGWTPKSRIKTWGFSIAKYGPQTGNDWQWEPDAGNGMISANDRITTNDPHDTSVEIGPQFVKDWIAHLQGRYGSAPTSGSVSLYSLDNEPMLWSSTHRDVRKTRLGYDELRDLTYTYAAAVKSQDPNAKTLGPCFWGWTAYFFSDLDAAPGGAWWNNPLDRNAHGGTPLAAWYLQQMKAYEDTTGTRLLDYFDLHYYPQVDNVFNSQGSLGNASVQAARLQATRALWDPTFNDGSWIGEPVYLIPRMKAWVAANYPGTKTCLSEYNFGAWEYMNGALAQADALGIFGREALDMAMLWTAPESDDPAAFAFRMYRNYDGTGKGFGETAVRATSSNASQLSVYAAERTYDGALTLVVVNKAASDLETTVTLANFLAGPTAEVWRYSPANQSAIVRQPDAVISAGAVPNLTFPAQSISTVVIPSSTPTPVSLSGWEME